MRAFCCLAFGEPGYTKHFRNELARDTLQNAAFSGYSDAIVHALREHARSYKELR